MTTRNVIIIGSGPAGYAAAIYLARAQLSPLVFAGDKFGGQLMLTNVVENFPGFPEGVLGSEFMGKMREQAKRFGAEVVDQDVLAVDFSKRPFRLWVGEGMERKEYLSKTVIIATGARARMLGIGEERLVGRGVSTCAVCDAAFFKDKVTFVVGGGDAAMEEAWALVRFARSVTIVHRRESLRASKILEQQVIEGHKDKVSVLWSSQVVGVSGREKLESVVVENLKTGKRKKLAADGLFLAIGHLPATELFKDQLKLNQKGYVVTHLNSDGSEVNEKTWLEGYPMMTSVPGVFAAGDVVDFRYRQALTAAGFGCMAALDVERYLTGSTQRW